MVVKWRSLEWIDIHTHHPGRGISVLDPCLGEVEFPTAGVVYRSLGIHPLLITEQAEKQLQAIEKAASNLFDFPLLRQTERLLHRRRVHQLKAPNPDPAI